jgi:hypothetical protein
LNKNESLIAQTAQQVKVSYTETTNQKHSDDSVKLFSKVKKYLEKTSDLISGFRE